MRQFRRTAIATGVTQFALIAGGVMGAPLALADDVVPKKPTCQMIRSLPAAPDGAWRIVLYPEGHHMLTRDLAGREPIDDIVAFMANPAKPVPSAAEIDRAEANRPAALRAEKLCGRFPPG